jgi:glycosyltransferase involved in cell wall biosynthesis
MRLRFIPGGPPEATYARVEGPARHLAAAGHFITSDPGTFWLDEEVARGTEAVILQRPTHRAHLGVFQACRLAGIATVVDLDVPLQAVGSGFVINDQFRPDSGATAACLREADLVSVPTQALADLLKHRVRRIEVLPDGYDDSVPAWTTARTERVQRVAEEISPSALTWFALVGEEDDYANVASRAAAIDQALGGAAARGLPAGVPQDLPTETTGLLVIGDSMLHDAFTLPYDRRRTVDLPDPDALAEALVEADVLLLPLADAPINRVASPRRVIEAAALGIPVVASQTPPVAALIAPGENGYLARTHADWVRAIGRLASSAEERQRCGTALAESVGQTYAWSKLVGRWEESYRRLIAAHGQGRGRQA